MFKLPYRGIAVLAGIAGLAASVNAETINFTYSDTSGISASGSLNATDSGFGYFLATSGSITILAAPAVDLLGTFNLLANPGAPGYTTSPLGAFNYDDLVYSPPIGSGYLDVYGLLFVRAGEEINIWGNAGPGTYSGWRYTSSAGYNYGNNEGDLQLTIVPLPPAAIAGLAGFVLVGGTTLRRRAAR